jgi:hypothetical protein
MGDISVQDEEPRYAAQKGPYPHELADLVDKCHYRPGWRIRLIDDYPRDENDETGEVLTRGLSLVVITKTYNSYHPEDGENYRVNHIFGVPVATYDRRSWRYWLFATLCKVDDHEAAEFFQIEGEGRPYAPLHLPGADPYMLTETSTDKERRTSFRGIENPE